MALTLSHHSLLLPRSLPFHQIQNPTRKPTSSFPAFRCSFNPNFKTTLKTCKNCKTQFDPSLNHPQACRFHTAHFGDSAVLGVYNLWRVLRTKRHSVKGIYFLLRSTIKAFHEKWKKRNYCSLIEAKHLGETKRKFESVYSGGTMDTPDSGQVFQYWHCCGSEDPFDPGCTAAPHSSYDD